MPSARPPQKPHERRRGQGSITETAPGVWRAWRAPGADGKRLSRRFSSHAAAHRWLTGEPEPTILYVGLHLERWLGLRAPTLRGRTPQTYAQFLRYAEQTDAPISVLPLSALTPDDCQAWLNGLLKTHTRYSVKVTRGIVGAALNAAVPHLIPSNPMKGTRLPSPEERPAKAWTAAEVGRLLDAAEGTPHAVWLAFALGTGLRLGELRALEWSDLDLAAMTVRVTKSLDNNTDQRGPTKTGRSRTVDVPDELRAQLVEHRARQRPSSPYVFGRGPRPHDPSTYRLWLRRVCLRAGVHDAAGQTLTAHSTRHTAASLLLSQGVEPMEVAHMLGHASIATTLNIYASYIPRRERRTAIAMGAILSEARDVSAPRLVAIPSAD